MPTIAENRKMLYCPKCKSKYEDGSQRFCDNDGGRLLAEPVQDGSGGAAKKVFTDLLRRSAPSRDSDEKLAGKPRFVRVEQKQPSFKPPSKSRIFKTENKSAVAQKVAKHVAPNGLKPPTTNAGKPLTKLIQSSEVSVSQIRTGEKKKLVANGSSLTEQDPAELLGQIVNGRYRIVDILRQDQIGIAYLSEDGKNKGKRVVVRVLIFDSAGDSFQAKIFFEERISLSQINHPNVVRVLGSDELPDGKPFIVTEFIEGKSIADLIRSSDEFNLKRAARVIRQASLALSEIHQSGILHRDLMPEHILLMVSDAGIEQVKVINFALSDGKPRTDNLGYKSPEQLGGELPTFASDSYSLAAIAFQMLTGQIPFDASSESELLLAQKAGLKTNASDLKSGIPEAVDQVFAKELSYNPADRYSKSRDFGEELFSAIAAGYDGDGEAEAEVKPNDGIPAVDKDVAESPQKQMLPDLHFPSSNADDAEDVTASDEASTVTQTEPKRALWKNRSPEAFDERRWLSAFLWIAGFCVLGLASIWAFITWINSGDQTAVQQPQETAALELEKPPINEAVLTDGSAGEDTPPPRRDISRPENSKPFENSKDKLDPRLIEHFYGFSLYYPDSWIETSSGTNFLDIKKQHEGSDFPAEQMLVTHYDSDGTFRDDKSKFSKLAKKSNKDLDDLVLDYEVAAEGEIEVNGWKAYEVVFTGSLPQEDSENLDIWGRRIWMPVARPGETDGFVITMFATSLSETVKSIDEVGKKGDLAQILKTFEPTQEKSK